MSWDWPSFATVSYVASAGACPGGGVDKTVMTVFKPTGAGFGCVEARLGSSAVWAMFLDSGQMFFGTGDFHGGPTWTAGEWLQAAARFTASGHLVNWRSRVTTGGGAAWGTWSNIADYSTGESGTTIDNLHMGLVFSDHSIGQQAAVGVWSSKLSDAAIDAAGVDLSVWRASGAIVWQMNAISTPPVAGDLIDITGGGATGTSYSTTGADVTLGVDPPSIAYYVPSGADPRKGAFMQFMGA